MKRVAILGSTGSIGSQTLDVIRHLPQELEVAALAANGNHAMVAQQAREFRPKRVAMYDPAAANELSRTLGSPAGSGMDGLLEIASAPDIDIVVVSVSGVIGLEPTLAALDSGKQVALASKEVLVAGGAIVMPRVPNPERLRPIDSEHSAVLQCLQGSSLSQVDKLILTASGGPFRNWQKGQLERVTPEQALNHPTWRMGGKITVDSATLMNKGLELIEACWLFDISPARVEVVVHPQSVIHSMVKFQDGSVLAQMGHPDMKLPIQYALLGPQRVPSPAKNWETGHTPNLSFEALDRVNFPLPDVAREAFRLGGVAPAYLNAVNEEAANAFIRGEIGFMDIVRAVSASISKAPKAGPTLENILEADAQARAEWRGLVTYA